VWVGNASGKTTTVATSSFVSTINTGSFVTTSSFNAYTASQSTASLVTSIDNLNTFSASALVSISNINTTTASLLVETQNLELFSASALISISNLNQSSASQQISIDNLNGKTGSYATTGSNTFRGNETFEDAGGNASTLVPTSGSLMLVAKTFTSASAHLSSSANSFVNLIFKNSSTAADTIISGSNNIFPNPTATTAGFKRYIGTSNWYTHGNSIPQLSGSMAWSPSFNGNIISHTQTNAFTWRGPVSSSASSINHNILMGGQINLGTAAATNHEKAISGVSAVGNALFNGTINSTAFVNTLTGSVSITGNLVFGAQVALNNNSSSLTYASNVQNGGITVNNNYTPISGSGAGVLNARVTTNTIYGTGHLLNINGSNTTTTQTKQFSYNILAGTFLTASVGDGDTSAILGTGIIGNGLVVTGSTSPSTALGADTANVSQGSVFVGRFNAQNGSKSKTAETVFAVGTGTGYTNRKTGFLIDSGSNTFIEGTLNVSGSSTFTGSLNGLTLTRGPGNNNTGLGVNVLQNAVSGGNVAIGTDALALNTSGTDNVALGNSALAANISGDRNMAIGSNTLDSNTTGTLNVAIGNATLAGLVDGRANVGIGFEALKNQITGSNNVGIGNQALNQNISGSGNIAFGAQAGYSETGSGNFYINNTSYGSINADRSGSLMWGTMNTTTTNQTLQINATTRITNDLIVYGNKQFNVGAFQSNITQSGSANVSQSMNFEVTDISQGVSMVSNSRITLANSGTYNIQFSAEVLADTGADDVYIWLKKNGTNVSASAGHISLANNAEAVLSWNYVVDAAAADYFELCWQSANGDAVLLAGAASGNIPSVPSVILTVTQVR
jgi:hypothetical protein